ncbi:MAG: hypothetical protein AAF892_02655 [Cyanobacteria bacterium P01_D01_bin.71]
MAPTSFHATLSKRDALKAFLGILAVTILTRLPYFFKADIDWDESTFFLLGQSVLDGHLPYTLWLDNKPPGLWYGFSAFLILGCQSLFGVRLIGSVWIASAAFLNYLSVRKFWGHQTGLVTGLALILFINLNEKGQAVLSEQVALLPMAASFAFLLLRPQQKFSLFAAGGLMTIAAMIRLNLAYTLVCLGGYVLITVLLQKETTLKTKIKQFSFFSFGCLCILGGVITPYLFTRQLDILYSGMIEAALSFSSSQKTPLSVLSSQISHTVRATLLGRVSISLSLVSLITFYALGMSGYKLVKHFKSLCVEQRRFYILAFIYLLSIEFSILQSGNFYGHYNIQLLFPISLLIAPQVQALLIRRNHVPRIAKRLRIIFFLALAIIGSHVFLQYQLVAANHIRNGTPFYGISFEIATVIEQFNPTKAPVWIQTNHLAYWLTDTKPVIPSAVHPSSLNKEFLLKAWHGEHSSTLKELQKILDAEPVLIVADRERRDLLADYPVAQQRLKSYLEENYRLLNTDYPRLIFHQRLK